MAKTFITSGTGASQTLDAIQNEKVPVYNTRADAEADLANIEEGGIVATKDTGATEKVVDVVEDGNMNPVTSNAVADTVRTSPFTAQDLAGNEDLNDILTPGLYGTNGEEACSNKPFSDANNFILRVEEFQGRILQTFICGNSVYGSPTTSMYIRIYGITGTTWSAWRLVSVS